MPGYGWYGSSLSIEVDAMIKDEVWSFDRGRYCAIGARGTYDLSIQPKNEVFQLEK